MSRHRIYQPEAVVTASPGALLSVEGDEAHHALRVKRLAEGEAVEVFDGAGFVARGVVAEAGRRVLAVRVVSVERVEPTSWQVVVAAPVPKGPRAETMVDMMSQAGVSRWIPLQTARGVVNPREAKVEKWRRLAVESAKQCGRAWLMEIDEPTPFERLEIQKGLALWLADAAGGPATEANVGPLGVVVLVGPEGGLTEEEKAWALEHGAEAVRLGPHVLRVETAAVVGAVTARALAESSAR